MATGTITSTGASGRQTLPYRTAFQTRLDFRETTDRTREQIRVWLRDKRYDVEKFDADHPSLAPGVVMRYAATNQVFGWQLREIRDNSLTWVSTVAVARGKHPDSTWISLNIESVASGEATPQPAATPRLVRLLLEAVDAFDGDAVLRPRPTVVNAHGVDDLLDIVCAEDRRLPLVVAAAPADIGIAFDSWRQQIERVFRYLPGLACTYLLDPVAAVAFNDGIGSTHWIGPGCIRTYLPGVDPAVSEDAIRHRVLSKRSIDGDPSRAARVLAALPRQFAATALPAIATRSLNLSIHDVRRTSPEPDGQVASLRDEVKLLNELLTSADHTEQHLREKIKQDQEEILDLTAELEIAQAKLVRSEALVRALRQRLIEAKLYEEAWTPAEEPQLPASFAEVLERMDQLGPYVFFTGDTGKCLDLDEKTLNSSWAQTAWRALLALADYARASRENGFAGDFKNWCESPPDGYRYAISAGKVARDESPTVRNNKKFSQARVLPVPKSIDPSGRVFMGAHIRLGNSTTVAPRMHFHDASHQDGAIYVGYIGPHLPNTLT